MAAAVSTRNLPISNGICRLISRLLAAVLLFPSTAYAFCQPVEDFDAWVKTKFGERPAYFGRMNGRMLRVYTTPERDTWTIAIEYPSGLVCLMAAGEDWQQEEARDGPET